MTSPEPQKPDPRPNRHGHWIPFIQEVEAMLLHDVLVWPMSQSESSTASARLAQIRSEEFDVISRWKDGKLFVVRTR